MTLVVATTEPTSLVAVNDQCAAVERWAEACESIPELQDANNKLAAINEYLERTSTEGRARVEAARRRLEVRIGKLLGPAQVGGDRRSDQVERALPDPPVKKEHRMQFRKMAANEGLVDRVIAESTDESPATRNSVLREIAEPGSKARLDKSRAAVAERESEAHEMARKGNTSTQIANRLGIGQEAVQSIAKRAGFEIPADVAMGRNRNKKFDADRIVATVVHDLEGARFTLNLLDYTELDRDRIAGWVDSLTESIRALNKLKTNLVKESTRGES